MLLYVADVAEPYLKRLHAMQPDGLRKEGSARLMNIHYFTLYCPLLPTTNRISDMRFCEGFAQNGCVVQLLAPSMHSAYNMKVSEVLSHYGIEHPFEITLLPTPFRRKLVRRHLAVLLPYIGAVYLQVLLRTRQRWSDVFVLSRNVNVLLPILLANKALPARKRPRVVHWAHEIKLDKPQYQWVYRAVDGIVGTNSAIIEDLCDHVAISEDKTAVSLNPISTRQLREPLTREVARARLGWQDRRPLVVYTGKLGQNVREIQFILLSAMALPEYNFLLTGGTAEALQFYRGFCERKGIVNVTFTGFLSRYTDVLLYQMAADVLVSFYTADHHLVDYNYPQKITEYMLTHNPIVTPNYRATSDVLSERNTLFVEPENAAALAQGIRRAVEDKAFAQRLARQAFDDVQEITFEKRTRHLMSFFQSLRTEETTDAS